MGMFEQCPEKLDFGESGSGLPHRYVIIVKSFITLAHDQIKPSLNFRSDEADIDLSFD